MRDEVIDNYEKRRTKPDFGALCDEDIEILKNWQWNHNITGDYAKFLTAQVVYVSIQINEIMFTENDE